MNMGGWGKFMLTTTNVVIASAHRHRFTTVTDKHHRFTRSISYTPQCASGPVGGDCVN